MSSSLKGVLLGLAGFCLFSVADATIKLLGDHYQPVQIVAFASGLTLPLIGLLWLKTRATLVPRHPWLMLVRTVALVANALLVTYTFAALPLAQAYAIFFTMPLVLTLLAWPVLGDRVDAMGGLAVVLGLIGVIVALNPGRVEFGLGHAAAVAGMLMAAVHYLIIRRIGGAESSEALLFWPVLGQAAVALLLLPGRYVPMPAADLATVASISVTGMGGTLLMFAAYRVAPPVVVAPTQYSQIAFAALFGALFFDEPMTAQMALGMCIIAAAGVLVVLRQERQKSVA
ncbi:MAG TPA: DMT family transporter [Tabrizicola sp.]|nr:DMT family transporter [Tabrizicola sp.]